MAYLPLLKLKEGAAKSRVGLLAAVVCVAGAAHGAAGDPLPFIGSWVFKDGTISLACLSPPQTEPAYAFVGTRVTVRPGVDADLVVDLGCDCQLKLNVTNSGSAELVGPQPCNRLVSGESIMGIVQQLSLVRSSSGFDLTLKGTASLDGILQCDPMQATFSGGGGIIQSGTPSVACGDDDTVVGVIPYDPDLLPYCPQGAGMEEVDITMRDETTNPCSAEPGAAGEGRWALPDDMRERHPDCASGPLDPPLTYLRFCRVDGQLFPCHDQ